MNTPDELFKQIKWGTETEYKGLLDTGKALALPLKEVKNDFEQDACELVSSILCMFVYKNHKRFNVNSLRYPLAESLLRFMKSANVIRWDGMRYRVKDYYLFQKWLETLSSFEIAEDYNIFDGTDIWHINYGNLAMTYYNNPPRVYSVNAGRVHPFTYYLAKFINHACYSTSGILAIKVMLDGLTYHTKHYIPNITEFQLKQEFKKANRDVSTALRNKWDNKCRKD